MAFKGAIFDFDGVVVDTTPLHYASWEKLITGIHQQPFDDQIYETAVNGRKSSEVIPELLPHLTAEEQQQALIFKQNYYHQLIEQGKLTVFSSTIKLIKELAANDIKVAVASSSRSVTHVLTKSNISNLFQAIISGKDTKIGKPHPEAFLTAALRLGLPPIECVVFEDAKVGVEAAKTGGFICIGIDRKNSPHKFVSADLCVKDLVEINYKKLATLFA